MLCWNAGYWPWTAFNYGEIVSQDLRLQFVLFSSIFTFNCSHTFNKDWEDTQREIAKGVFFMLTLGYLCCLPAACVMIKNISEHFWEPALDELWEETKTISQTDISKFFVLSWINPLWCSFKQKTKHNIPCVISTQYPLCHLNGALT